jgi:hypothetical protein
MGKLMRAQKFASEIFPRMGMLRREMTLELYF